MWISANAERAQLAAESGSDILIRIHANGSDNTSVAGALTMAPSMANPYLSQEMIAECTETVTVYSFNCPFLYVFPDYGGYLKVNYRKGPVRVNFTVTNPG